MFDVSLSGLIEIEPRKAFIPNVEKSKNKNELKLYTIISELLDAEIL